MYYANAAHRRPAGQGCPWFNDPEGLQRGPGASDLNCLTNDFFLSVPVSRTSWDFVPLLCGTRGGTTGRCGGWEARSELDERVLCRQLREGTFTCLQGAQLWHPEPPCWASPCPHEATEPG